MLLNQEQKGTRKWEKLKINSIILIFKEIMPKTSQKLQEIQRTRN